MTAPDPGPDVLVVAGGPLPPLDPDGWDGWVVVAADSGLHTVLAAGLLPAIVVGDLDSADGAEVDAARAAGARIDRFPAEKDATDLELALEAAMGLAPRRVRVVAGLDGRADHALAGALLLAAPRFAAIPQLEAQLGRAEVRVLHGSGALEVRGEVGELVSLLAIGGVAEGVTTHGLRYPLRGEALHPGSTRGVSNELVVDVATVAVTTGVLLVVRPGTPDR